MIKTIHLNPVILHLATVQFPIRIAHVDHQVPIRTGLPDFSTSNLQYALLRSKYRKRRFARRFTERFVSGKSTEWTVYTSTGLRMWFVDVFARRTVSILFLVCD